MQLNAMHSHYDNLKVRRDASQADIKAAYRRLRSEHHPDRNKDPRATVRMQVINEAWEVLSDPKKRAKHDEEIRKHEKLEEFLREVENQNGFEVEPEEKVHAEAVPDPTPEPEDPTLRMQAYFEQLGWEWMKQSRESGTYGRVEPTYRVYRMEFKVGPKVYYLYGCYKGEFAKKRNRVKNDLGMQVDLYMSNYIYARLANQKLMDAINEQAGVLWTEGEPHGDVTDVFFNNRQ